ncbi:hypothetical protein DSM3645_12186 [Blastopirellula marina DSM 3645]|uniref:Uncharacterized protein n=1 Tax=Blastopirellula marina DSM 3645 TaxID=314230 RepID=A3ZRK7_9BACT|nr:hypothetical protein DSM3645_12186 [Blastopirellula marina DSM 3645]
MQFACDLFQPARSIGAFDRFAIFPENNREKFIMSSKEMCKLFMKSSELAQSF